MGFIHQTISPERLLLVKHGSGDEITKVIDCRAVRQDVLHSEQATEVVFMQEPEYSSPEQCGMLEAGQQLDGRSDIYSLAITFYQMLTGKLPFYSPTPEGYLSRHRKVAPLPVSTYFGPEQFSPLLDRMLQKALSKNPDDRHSSMEEFIHEIDHVSSVQATTAFGFTPPAPSEPFPPGMVFSERYVIEKKIGEGGMGMVFKAMDTMLNVPVALKLMTAHLVHSEKVLDRFKREVILARKVAHPNVCRIYDFGQSEGVAYVSMEFLQGRNLADMLRDGPLTLDVGIPILKQVLTALKEAHRVGVVHRDLKPQNIMVSSRGHPWIMDFGISVSTDVDRVTKTGAIMGTPHYMAPEQLDGKRIDRRADIYSMGVILYEVFTGKLPFEGSSAMAILLARLKSAPRKPSEVAPDIPDELEAIILKALEKNSGKRYQTTQDLLMALDNLQDPSRRGAGKRRFRYAQSFLLATAVVLGLLLVFRSQNRKPDATVLTTSARVPTPAQNIEKPPDSKAPEKSAGDTPQTGNESITPNEGQKKTMVINTESRKQALDRLNQQGRTQTSFATSASKKPETSAQATPTKSQSSSGSSEDSEKQWKKRTLFFKGKVDSARRGRRRLSKNSKNLSSDVVRASRPQMSRRAKARPADGTSAPHEFLDSLAGATNRLPTFMTHTKRLSETQDAGAWGGEKC